MRGLFVRTSIANNVDLNMYMPMCIFIFTLIYIVNLK